MSLYELMVIEVDGVTRYYYYIFIDSLFFK